MAVKLPTISVVVAVCNGEDYIAEALTSILSQTCPPDEVIVIDDGSTDGTLARLAPFGRAIRIVGQSNRGHPGAYNRGFAEAHGDYVARCDADDIWEPDKLERQRAALIVTPEIDIVAGAAWIFGLVDRIFAPPPGDGVLDTRWFAEELYRANMLCASSTLISRRLFEHVGPFTEHLACEDYDFWLRAAASSAVFFYDPAIVVRYRRHGGNVSNDLMALFRAVQFVHLRHAEMIEDRRLVRQVLAEDRAAIGRLLVEDDARMARDEFVGALRHRLTPRELTWALVLSMPDRCQRTLVPSLASTARAISVTRQALRGAQAQ